MRERDALDLIEIYLREIASLRRIYSSVLSPSGRPSKGPRYFAILECQECGNLGMASSKIAERARWSCRSCSGCRLPIWSDGEIRLSKDEIWERWAKHQPKERR